MASLASYKISLPIARSQSEGESIGKPGARGVGRAVAGVYICQVSIRTANNQIEGADPSQSMS